MVDFLGYQGKVCVVTGAASGIGKAAAEDLVALGAQVYALDYRAVDLAGVTAFIEVDLASKDQIDAAFAELPDAIDAFFGVAGVSGTQHTYLQTLVINLVANRYITETYLDERIVAGGAICYVTSAGGLNWQKYPEDSQPLLAAATWDDAIAAATAIGDPDASGVMAYPLSKRALNYYTAMVAPRFAAKNVRVNAVLPASTDTGMTDQFAAMVGGMDNLVSHTGLAQRLAVPQEMAQPAIFLNSPMAGFITGVCLSVDYGARAGQLLGSIKDTIDIPLTRRS